MNTVINEGNFLPIIFLTLTLIYEINNANEGKIYKN